MRRLMLALFTIGLAAGCKSGAQVPPSQPKVVSLTWVAPAKCDSTCSYVISRITTSASSCPAPNVSTPNYAPLNQSAPVSGLAFTDSSASGLTVCYIAQTLQGGAVSQPSNTVGPFAVPGLPLAPAISGAQQ